MDNTLTIEFDKLPPDSAGCAACLERLQSRLQTVAGIETVELLRERGRVLIGLSEHAEASEIAATARRIMSEVSAGYVHETLRIGGMDCPSCASEIEAALDALPGVAASSVDFASARMSVEYDTRQVTAEAIRREIRNLGFSAQPVTHVEGEKSLGEAVALVGGGILWVIALLLSGAPPWVQAGAFVLAALVAGWRMLRAGAIGLLNLKFTTNTLMTVAVTGAMAIGEWPEAALVAWLFALGNFLQTRTMKRTRTSVKALIDAAPKTAIVRTPEGPVEMGVAEVKPGDVFEVRPFSQVPVDGEVVEGGSHMNNAALTGESEPVWAGEGSKVLAGALAEGGSLVVRADRSFSDTTYAKMLDLIERGQSSRTSQQEMIDRVSAWYTPAVIIAAALFATIAPMTGLRTWHEGLHQAFWLLMVACPCALVISIPVAVVTAVGTAARCGALVKGGAFLEALSKVRYWVFDKTGTLTHSRLKLEEIVILGEAGKEEALRLAAAVAGHSVHPVSRAIARAASGMALPAPEYLEETPGRGAAAVVEGRRVLVGNADFVRHSSTPPGANGGSGAYVSVDGVVLAFFKLSDAARADAAEIMSDIRRAGGEPILFSGDDSRVVQEFSERLSIASATAAMTPEEKASQVEALSRQGGVAMVGDGINDTAALQRSTVGIAMGAAGSDAAIESADIVLLNDDLKNISRLIKLSRRFRRVLSENIVFSLVTKAALIVAGSLFILPFWLSVAGDMGVALLVTANALRLRSA